MYRLLVVDDEALVRLGIKNCINWHEIGFEEPLEASNGKEALALIRDQKVDIILTDIRMPEMNGLEMIKSITSDPERPEVIILSCYNEFEYVREAMLYGARDFLFKPKMYPDDIVDALQRTVKHLEARKKVDEKLLTLQKKIEEDYAWKKESFLIDLIEGKKISNSEFTSKASELGIRLSLNNLVVLFFRVGNFTDISLKKFNNEHYRLKASIKEIIAQNIDAGKYCEIICRNINEYVVFYTNPDSSSEFKAYTESMAYGKKVLNMLKKNLCLEVSGGVSRVYNGINWIFNAYNEAVLAAYRSELKGYGNIVWFDERNDIPGVKSNELMGILDDVFNLTGYNYVDNLKAIFQKVKNIGSLSLDAVRELGANIINRLFRNYLDHENVLTEIYKKFPMVYQIIFKMNSILEIENYVMDLAYQLNTITEKHLRRDIILAAEFIKAHISDPDLSFEKVAQQVNISKNYFSRLFRETMGESFSDYVIRTRLEHGRDLYLKGNMKVYEIAEKVGYPNWRYFTRLYKKRMGARITDNKKLTR